jgi:hypothetical protein
MPPLSHDYVPWRDLAAPEESELRLSAALTPVANIKEDHLWKVQPAVVSPGFLETWQRHSLYNHYLRNCLLAARSLALLVTI